MVFQNDILAGASGTAAGYTIDQSIRFARSDSAYLTKTFSTDEGDTWTLSVWIKRGQITSGNNQYWFSEAGGSGIGFVASTDTLRLFNGSTVYNSTPVFRDPSSWYHIVFSNNSGTWVCYVNGSQVDGFTGTAANFNRNNAWSIGRYQASADNYFDGYMADFYWIGDQALAATDFGETNNDGVWVPKQYAGSFGTNGFYLKGQDSADLGNDSSGNNNDFTSSGLTSDDQRSDTPTNNLMIFNPLNNMRGAGNATDGNRVFKNTGSTRNLCGTTFHFTTGKYVQAFSYNATGSNDWQIGSQPSDRKDVNDAPGSNEDLGEAPLITPIGTYYVGVGLVSTNNTGITADTADTIWVAMDLDSGKQWVGLYDNSASSMIWFDSSAGSTGDPATGANPVYTGTANRSYNFALCGRDSVEITLLEESEATGTVPTGFTYVGALKDTYAAPAVTDGSAYFQTTLYTGTGAPLEINQTGNSTFQPDMVWAKSRSASQSHRLADAIRGSAVLFPDLTNAEDTTAGISFDADGFSWTNSDGSNANDNTVTYAAWQWLAGNGTASNTDGDITSTVSANTTAGFSVLTYSGSGTTNDTVGHGLGVKPSVVIVKPRNSADNWIVNDWSGDYVNKLKLNSNEASSSAANFVNAASSTTFTLGSDINVNGSGRTFVAYCWSEVEGFSKFGTYTGNGSANGPFVWCGFRPAFILVKEYTSADDWLIYDAARDPYNVAGRVLRPDSSAAEFDGRGGSRDVDFLSNGFKFRSSNATMNGNGVGYLFMAFAENPFGGNGVAPVPAR